MSNQGEGASCLTEVDVLRIRRCYDHGMSVAQLARDLGVSYSVVHNVAKRKTWRHMPELEPTRDAVADFTRWWEYRIQNAAAVEQGKLIRARAMMLKAWEAARA